MPRMARMLKVAAQVVVWRRGVLLPAPSPPAGEVRQRQGQEVWVEEARGHRQRRRQPHQLKT